VFSECGSWKNFEDLEDSLNLEELLELYQSAIERFNRMAKLMVSAMGGTIEEPSNSSPKNSVYDQHDLAQLPIGIGYEVAG
jgi:hypothetical protein